MFKNLFKNEDFGLFLARLLLGMILIFYGVSYLQGGASAFHSLGQQGSVIGLNFAYTLWGFLAMLVYAAGGFCLIIGFLFRWICLAVLFLMVIGILQTYSSAFSLLSFDLKTPHCVTAAAIALAFIFIGPGSWSVDGKD